MHNFYVLLSSINDVKQFVNAACSMPCDIDVVSGRYIIDAKSIMGLFSLDLAKPIKVEIHGTDDDAGRFYELVKEFVHDNGTE